MTNPSRIPVLLPPARGTQAFRIAAIRRFLDNAAGSTDADWISHCLDVLQGAIGSVEGLQVAKAAGFDLS